MASKPKQHSSANASNRRVAQSGLIQWIPIFLTQCFAVAFPAFTVAGLSVPSAAAQESQFKAGAAVVDISPDVFPFQLRSGPSSFVHDPISVRALAFENGADHRCLIAIIDAIGIGREMADEAKLVVAEKTGWNPECIMIAATHAHTTPKGGDTSPGRIAYEKKRRAGLAEVLVKAIGALEPARVGFASDEEASEVRNRRNFYKEGTSSTRNPFGGYDRVRMNGGTKGILKPAGPIDPEICVVDVRTIRNQPIGLLANYALHYVGGIPTVTEENGRIRGMASADYFGEFARVMPFRMGGTPAGRFCGDDVQRSQWRHQQHSIWDCTRTASPVRTVSHRGEQSGRRSVARYQKD